MWENKRTHQKPGVPFRALPARPVSWKLHISSNYKKHFFIPFSTGQIYFRSCFQRTAAEKCASLTSHHHCLPPTSPFSRFGRICFVIMEINVIFLQLLTNYTQRKLTFLLHLILIHKIRLLFFKHMPFYTSLRLQSQGAWPYLLLFLVWYLLQWCLRSRFTCNRRDFQLSLFQRLL